MALENIACVEQRSFGVLMPESPYTALQTFSISNCVGLYLKSNDIAVLTHLDALNGTQGDLKHIFQYFQQRWLRFVPHETIITTSSDSDPDTVDKIGTQLGQMKIPYSIDVGAESRVHIQVDRNGYTKIPFRKCAVDKDILDGMHSSFDRSMKGDKTYQMECVTDKGWSKLERLPCYGSVDDGRIFIGQGMSPKLPFDIIIGGKAIYQNVDFQYSEQEMETIRRGLEESTRQLEALTQGLPPPRNKPRYIRKGEYKGDYIVRKLEPWEVERVQKIMAKAV